MTISEWTFYFDSSKFQPNLYLQGTPIGDPFRKSSAIPWHSYLTQAGQSSNTQLCQSFRRRMMSEVVSRTLYLVNIYTNPSCMLSFVPTRTYTFLKRNDSRQPIHIPLRVWYRNGSDRVSSKRHVQQQYLLRSQIAIGLHYYVRHLEIYITRYRAQAFVRISDSKGKHCSSGESLSQGFFKI